jgi:hypothetical protein
MGWNYALLWLVSLPLEIIAASITISFWEGSRGIDPTVWVTIFFVAITVINLFGVKGTCINQPRKPLGKHASDSKNRIWRSRIHLLDHQGHRRDCFHHPRHNHRLWRRPRRRQRIPWSPDVVRARSLQQRLQRSLQRVHHGSLRILRNRTRRSRGGRDAKPKNRTAQSHQAGLLANPPVLHGIAHYRRIAGSVQRPSSSW